MAQSDDDVRDRAAAIAAEVVVSLRRGQSVEWVEEVLGSALLDVARAERERCAAAAERRIEMWEASLARMTSGSWPAAGVAEARARLNEARALADALRVALRTPPES